MMPGERQTSASAAPGGHAGGRRLQGRAPLFWFTLAVLALIGAYLASGFYLVDTDEEAVVRRFGAIVAQEGPGMHYRLPWPIDRVDVLKTTAVMNTGVGFALGADGQDARRHGAADRRHQHPEHRAGAAVRHPGSRRLSVPDRRSRGADRRRRGSRADRDRARDAGRRRADHGALGHSGRGQEEDAGAPRRVRQRHPDHLVEHHDDHARQVGRRGLPGGDRRHGGSREEPQRGADVRQHADPEDPGRGARAGARGRRRKTRADRPGGRQHRAASSLCSRSTGRRRRSPGPASTWKRWSRSCPRSRCT